MRKKLKNIWFLNKLYGNSIYGHRHNFEHCHRHCFFSAGFKTALDHILYPNRHHLRAVFSEFNKFGKKLLSFFRPVRRYPASFFGGAKLKS